jgi:hypothetical protein
VEKRKKGTFGSTTRDTQRLVWLSSLRKQLQDEEEQVQHIQVQVDGGQDILVVVCPRKEWRTRRLIRLKAAICMKQTTARTELGAEQPRVVDNVQGEDDRAEERVAGTDHDRELRQCANPTLNKGKFALT